MGGAAFDCENAASIADGIPRRSKQAFVSVLWVEYSINCIKKDTQASEIVKPDPGAGEEQELTFPANVPEK